ncbi:TetR/AcrR family transcriptional regulator [Achromobacter xylosoxidans]|uniref:TetR/AcrR family transcriptional regulator n=1 Tax=Alcaligenes xylosoxydans xylosoxydans TaxID=85698 RepID=UPI001F13D6AD|nr:TetR/AcrR family transcriptional regulator [Achromobacter xylosoxidans]
MSNVREQILDAAEIDFADRGYAGTSLRDIANATNVTQALITYYFGTKQQLFKQVFLRRALFISSERMRLLDELRHAATPPTLENVVRTFLAPMLELRKSVGGRAFIRLHARLHTEPPEISYPLRSQAYDESMRAYIQALQKALPDLPAKVIYWRATLMVGAYLYAFSDAHRLEVLSRGVCDPNDEHETFDQLLGFILGGLKAEMRPASGAAASKKAPAKKTKSVRSRAPKR